MFCDCLWVSSPYSHVEVWSLRAVQKQLFNPSQPGVFQSVSPRTIFWFWRSMLMVRLFRESCLSDVLIKQSRRSSELGASGPALTGKHFLFVFLLKLDLFYLWFCLKISKTQKEIRRGSNIFEQLCTQAVLQQIQLRKASVIFFLYIFDMHGDKETRYWSRRTGTEDVLHKHAQTGRNMTDRAVEKTRSGGATDGTMTEFQKKGKNGAEIY